MTQTNDVSVPSGDRSIVLPIGMAVLSVAAVALPIINVNIMGIGTGVTLSSPALMGGIAYVLPLAFLVALASRFAEQLRPHQRVADIVALAIAAALLLYVGIQLLNGLNELNAASKQMSQFMGSANARQFSMPGGLSIGSGFAALGLLVLGNGWQVWKSRR